MQLYSNKNVKKNKIKIKFCLKIYHTDGKGEKKQQQQQRTLRISLWPKTYWREPDP